MYSKVYNVFNEKSNNRKQSNIKKLEVKLSRITRISLNSWCICKSS